MSGLLTPTSAPHVRQKQRYSVRPFYLSLLLFIALAAVSWVAGAWSHDSSASVSGLLRRGTNVGLLGHDSDERECRLVRTVKDQCSFVRSHCPDDEEGLFSYLQFYYCSLTNAKPLAFIILILWLSLLFSTIGIAASDFLCIDLSTLASVLGLSESLTGVTFLAFGNGSPDVFSTFAAMRSNSGSLAIGELLGAASFITSVVAGSMALVRPFRVARRSFVRDVGYFVIAVSFSMFFVADGRLHVWESAAMVGLYCFYVVMVVTWHWYLARQRRVHQRNLAARSHFHIPDNQELAIEEAPEDDDPGVAAEPTGLHGASAEDFDALERSAVPAWKEGNEDDEARNRYLAEIRENMHVYRPRSSRRRNTLNPIRPSLVGALEFRSVLSSLEKSKSIHQNSSINLDRYSDSPEPRPQHQPDNRSLISNLSIDRPSTSLPPDNAVSQSRPRAVSANDLAGLRNSQGVVEGDQVPQPVNVTVSRPSGEENGSNAIPAQVPPPGQPRQLSPAPTADTQSAGLLAPPDTFHSPNYQTEPDASRSPSQVSPRGTTLGHSKPDFSLDSPASPFPPFSGTASSVSSRAPSIRLPDAPSPSDSLLGNGNPFGGHGTPEEKVKWWPYSLLPSPQSLKSTFFPTFEGWKSKSLWARFLDIVAAPSVLLLTITVPVVEPAQPEVSGPIPVVVEPTDDGDRLPPVQLPADSPLIQAADHGQRTADLDGRPEHHSPPGRQRVDSELPASQLSNGHSNSAPKEWNRWLISLQLFTGPFFITLVAWTATDPAMNPRNLLIPSLSGLLFSLLCLTAFILSTRNNSHQQPPGLWRPFLALLGFVVAISWIACIATEVVSLLKTLGVILNISDSLLGLTVFAVGNSLGDLVADITVARLGYPVMALSACFGGPMLNILLGIGLGGLYMTLSPKSNSSPSFSSTDGGLYLISISKVLAISSATLLFTLIGLLIVVPLNNWRMDRKIGWGLVFLWVVSTLSNVIVEIVV